jgi:hypothetical protein
MKAVVDEYYNGLYEQTHGQELYGTSSVAFLPEVMQSFLLYASAGRIDVFHPISVLDYGCGRSILLDVFAKVVNDNKDSIQKFIDERSSLASLMDHISGSMEGALAGYSREQYAEMLLWDGGIIDKHRFDPAIPEYASFPQGKYDFLICTDVFEHIPEFGGENKAEPILENVIEQILDLCPNPFLNISTRLAMQRLPDGQNAHCTLKSPQVWQDILQRKNSAISPMFSRDFTSCHFVRAPLCEAFHDVSYSTYKKFGEIDLIAYPGKKILTPQKESALVAIQEHKLDIRSRNMKWWIDRIDCRAYSHLPKVDGP